MSFVKYGDGKIVTVLDEEELTDAQKNAVKESQTVKQSNESDASSTKKSGR